MLGERSAKQCTLYGACPRFSHFYPLIFFLVPTVLIGYGLVIPRSCIAGLNDKTVGFATALAGAGFAYWQGVRLALRASSANKAKSNATP
jgi:hypothetical protein